MKITIVDTEDGFDGLEAVWNELAGRTPSSFFSSFDYVRTAWQHFHGTKERLFILVFSEADTILGIAPFCIIQRRIRGIPCRIVRFIAAWEGDRPQILTARSEIETWRTLFRFLENEFTSWEILDLIEQPVEGLKDSGWSFLPQSGWYWESQPDVVDYYNLLGGSWEEYFSGLSGKTRQKWRSKINHLAAAPGGYKVERIAYPAGIREALARFVAIEQSGWKAGTKIGVGKDQKHHSFYEDLVIRLAGKEQVMFHFLKIGQVDAAGFFCFMHGDVIYGRHTAYLPAYAAYSPGLILLAEIIRESCMGKWRELDLLGIKEEDGSSLSYKRHWLSGKRETIHWSGYHLWGRLLPVIAGKRLKRLRGKRVGAGVPNTVRGDSNGD
jgi:CelD/BcsL family acetyltransferase involved in cellulose biosynthesis